MKKVIALAVAALATMTLLVAPVSATAKSSPELPEVDLEAYAGKWFELGRTPNSFQDNELDFFGIKFSGCVDTEVTYKVNPKGYVDLVNSCTRVNEKYDWEFVQSIDGSAFPVKGQNGQLKVAFGPAPIPQLVVEVLNGGGDYWVYALGPIVDGEYQWAVVGGATLDADLFILTRDEEVPDSVKDEILGVAASKGLPVDELQFLRR